MISNREAWIADRIRKALTFLVSAVGTTLLLRVLYRLAHGRQTWADLELWGFVVLTILAILWIRATRRMPRSAVRKDDDPVLASSDEGGDV